MNARAWMQLFRPGNALIAGAAVWLGWASMSFRPEWQLPAWGCLAMFLLVAAGNADNDVRDLAVDRVNRPDRPLPSGRIGIGAAQAAAVLLYFAAVFSAWMGSAIHGALALLMAILLWIYNRFLKGAPLLGNLAVALLCALAVYFAEFPLPPWSTLPAIVFAFVATLAREIAKDAEDMEGDRAAGLRTFALVGGEARARKLIFFLIVLLALLLPAPLLAFGYKWPYAALSIALVAPFLLMLMWELARPDADFKRSQKLLKWVMLGGLIALLAGVLGR